MASCLAVEKANPPGSLGGRKEGCMYARVTTIQGSSGKMDDAKGHTQEQTLPQLQKMEGFKGFLALGDRNSGKLIGVSFWESEEALRATDEAVSSVRSGVAEAADGIVAGVEQYEVLVNEAPSDGPISGATDTLGGVTQPVSGATDTVGGLTDTVGGTTGNLLGGG